MRILLDRSVDRLTVKVLVGEAEVLGNKVLLATELQVVVHFLQLEHEVIDNRFTSNLHCFSLNWDLLTQKKVPKFFNHEKLLQDGVDVASGSEIAQSHVFRPHFALLRRQHSL